MSDIDPILAQIVRAICDGTGVDWETLERTATESVRRHLAAIKIVDTVARVHGAEQSASAAQASPASAASDGSPDPSRWGHLELLDHVASGAFGDVYRAWDPALDRVVALKLLRRGLDVESQDDDSIEEGRLLARIRHANVVTIYGAARLDGRVGIWMEFLQGRTLGDAVAQDGPLAADRVAHIGVALCDALTAVHAAGLIHRDIKPQNVMLTPDGRVVLMDFGAGRGLLHAGLDLAGTPRYLAPELLRGAAPSARTDIFSLGVLLRYALLGRSGTGTESPNVPGARRLIAVAERAAAPDPLARYHSAGDCRSDVQRALANERSSHRFRIFAAALSVAIATFLIALTSSNTHSAAARFTASWRAAIAARIPLLPEDTERLDFSSPFNGAGWIAGTSWSSSGDLDLVTADLHQKITRAWMRVRTEEGHLEFPQLSPDGRAIAYVWIEGISARGEPLNGPVRASIRVVDMNGAERVLFSRADVRAAWLGQWTTHGMPALLASNTTRYELAVIYPQKLHVLSVAGVDGGTSGAALSTDGARVALALPRTDPSGRRSDILVRDLRTGRESWLFNDAVARSQPVWSPDGAGLFYMEQNGEDVALAGVPLANGRPVGTPVRFLDRMNDVSAVTFLDAHTLAYWRTTSPAIFVAKANRSGIFDTTDAARLADEAAHSPTWSPDGRSLAWGAQVGPNGVLHLEGLQPRHSVEFATTGEAWLPAWSHSGKLIAYWSGGLLHRSLDVTDTRTGKTTIVDSRVHSMLGTAERPWWVAGTNAVLVSWDSRHIDFVDVETRRRREVYDASPRFLLGFCVVPDGHSLAVARSGEPEGDLRLVPLDGHGRSGRVGSTTEAHLLVGCHPDGQSVIEVRSVATNADYSQSALWQVPLDGTAPRLLGLRTHALLYASVSPDAQLAAYQAGGNARELWTLTAATVK